MQNEKTTVNTKEAVIGQAMSIRTGKLADTPIIHAHFSIEAEDGVEVEPHLVVLRRDQISRDAGTVLSYEASRTENRPAILDGAMVYESFLTAEEKNAKEGQEGWDKNLATMAINAARLPEGFRSILVCAEIYKGDVRKQDLSSVRKINFKLEGAENHEQFLDYDLEGMEEGTVVTIGRLDFKDEECTFTPFNGTHQNMRQLSDNYLMQEGAQK